MITDKQLGKLSYQIRTNRKNNQDLWDLFPDRIDKGANRAIQDAERLLAKLDKFTASTIIDSFLKDDIEGATNQLKHLKNEL